MARNWELIAAALDLNIPELELQKLLPPLDLLEATFRPLVKAIPNDVEPAISFHCYPEERR